MENLESVIEVHEFHKDHWSLLAYVEDRCVEYKGELDREHMRCNYHVHPLLQGYRNAGRWRPEYATRLKGNVNIVLQGHDDWDCLEDLENAGLIEIVSLVNGFVTMTKLGIFYAQQLRVHKQNGGRWANFVVNI